MNALLLIWVVLSSTAATPIEIPCDAMGAYRECRVATSGKIRLVREISENRCHEGLTWGTHSDGVVWVDGNCRATFTVQPTDTPRRKPTLPVVTCQSSGDDRTHCPADTKFGVAFARQLGEKECVLDRSWGFDGEGIWVSGGCHAQFALGGYRLPPLSVPASAERLFCESRGGKGALCPANTFRGVGLVRQTSKADCILNRTWGYDEKGIWVTEGCAAEFVVPK